ncbi:MAG: ABC transporter permease [Pseudomonadota bacterium]|nr:ABC transporter permease [Pseudomonadota bacterium]
MTPTFQLALKSLISRRLTVVLTVFAIAVSVSLLLGVERIRTEVRASFANTVSGTDLIIGARSGSVPLLLYTVFRIGSATNNISWSSYREIAADPNVAWTIPISLGDSHRGFRVLGTSAAYFSHLRFARTRQLEFDHGKPFEDVFDAVLGANVASKLGYTVGDRIVIDHGVGQIGFASHKDKPFRVSGVLARTGTPVDQTVHVSLAGIEAIHVDWRSGRPIPGLNIDADSIRQMNLQPKAITAFFVGLQSRFSTFDMQRRVNNFTKEPLLAILPGVALHELWSLMGTAESALTVITIFVVAAGMVGMITMLISTLNERRREMAILRSVGARPYHIFLLLILEAVFVSAMGAVLGVAIFFACMLVVLPVIEARYGLFIAINALSINEWIYLGSVVAAGIVAGIVPAIMAVRRSLADGMLVRN